VATGLFELFGATVQPVNKQARKARLTKRRFTIFGSSEQCVLPWKGATGVPAERHYLQGFSARFTNAQEY
jgi:hypothetical protein